MRIEENNNGLYLFVDIDDFLVKSSPLIQKQVNEKTGFKTETLSMLEQTKRNCLYYRKHVASECTKAFLEKRMPELEDFLLRSIGLKRINPFYFDKLTDQEKDLIYNKPIQMADSLVDASGKILEQFLEERDTFLEIDNLPSGQIKKFNIAKEMITIDHYIDLLHNSLYGLTMVNDFCVSEIKRIVNDAKKRNTGGALIIPDYGDLVRMDSNDIIKTNSISANASKEYVLYEKPIETIRNCFLNKSRFYDIITNASVFSTPSAELIDYDYIYQRCHVNYEAVYLVEKLMESGRFVAGFALTHHNGAREMRAKMRLISEVLPILRFIGIRFHSEEHDAERRKRSSKMEAVIEMGIDSRKSALLDDSRDNCADWKNYEGQEILYKPRTDSEIINGVMERSSLERITDFNYSVVIDIIDEMISKLKNSSKRKVMVRKDGE